MGRTYVIGVAGGTASGKTTIVKIIKDYFGEGIELIGHDCYYKAHDDMPFAEREKLNYDHPQSFDTERMVADVIALKEGRTIQRPVYDYSVHNRSEETVTVRPKKILMLEGILILESEALRNLMDLRIFVDTADAQDYTGYGGAGPKCGIRSPAVPHDRETDARTVCGTIEKICRPDYSQGREKYGGSGDT